MTDSWFDDWDPETLYLKDVENVDKAADKSPWLDSAKGIVCGPTLRLKEILYSRDGTQGTYKGSMLIITKNQQESPVVEYSMGLAPFTNRSKENILKEQELNDSMQLEQGFFKPTMFHKDTLSQFNNDMFYFHRYNIELPLAKDESMIKYSIDNKTEGFYRFFVPGLNQNCNSIAYSCNGFSLKVNTTTFKGSLWLDILRKHSGLHYHCMMGGGDQIYSDQITLRCAKVKQWLDIKDPIKRHKMKVDKEFMTELDEFYLKEYIDWYGYGYWKGGTTDSNTTQRCFPKAMSTIPHINIWDDHDIIDGFGSYDDKFMGTEVFSSIGQSAFRYYMLFQHHVSSFPEDKDQAEYLNSNHWILGKNPGPYTKEKNHTVYTSLGPNMAMLGLDCRTERKLKEIVSHDSYAIVFKRLYEEAEKSKGKLNHLMVMLGVPIAYPRLVWLEWLFTSKLLAPIKYLSKKGIVARGLVNDFNGDVELLDDLNDHWCARHHKAERNYLLSKLQDYSAKFGVRVTILSGDVHLASLGRFYSKEKVEPELDPRLVFNVISSAVVNTPPPDAMPKLLQQRAKRGHRLDHQTLEDSVALFKTDVNKSKTLRPASGFYNRRNWSEVVPIENALNSTGWLNKQNETDKKQWEIGSEIIPGDNERGQSYKIENDGVAVTIHVEKDYNDLRSNSRAYSFPIPGLHVHEKTLDHKGLKHRGEF
ncbi:hypothetical protein TBLA_0C06790 [Henningerozyma blattae CBS 6284]|uniref:PhoD-like phosphatase domain-containing protein n=1 Tax=Henningerozyma blattae (strain ATCC 34711 / CBS 6284 / DSM 70876 / NBRC 10599 / NRRL Y-10934 / UCD 77-7) TaxID=1071380 RepID=I2H269_HENB6|nr:hypothetical protein TBLA_0C06790 [Tetrapisispora blattae CBS 6284]CCH60471.1 hypothetical protein TBLA_0C06790 [Tetrapisispora blattae CBS 6284]